MKNKARKPEQKGILHIGQIVPITDPAEQAALDRRCRDAEKVLAAKASKTGNARTRKRK